MPEVVPLRKDTLRGTGRFSCENKFRPQFCLILTVEPLGPPLHLYLAALLQQLHSCILGWGSIKRPEGGGKKKALADPTWA